MFDLAEFKHSPNGNNLKRLNFRYENIIEKNKHLIKNKTVIDVGCHDCRWSYAAEQAGATQVQAFDINNLYEISGVSKLLKNTTYQRADFHQAWENIKPADTTLCLGFLYHQYDIKEILKKISDKSNNLILDTYICLNESRPLLELKPEGAKARGFKLLQNTLSEYNLVPNLSALKILLKCADYKKVKVLEPNKNSKYFQTDYIENRSGKRKRITLVAMKNIKVDIKVV